jgi:hypothetical protein
LSAPVSMGVLKGIGSSLLSEAKERTRKHPNVEVYIVVRAGGEPYIGTLLRQETTLDDVAAALRAASEELRESQRTPR